MKNALILHAGDYKKGHRQILNNWYPWLKFKLVELGYQVWLPELPQSWHPDLERYWSFLKNFNYNQETILIGHNSGGAMVFGVLHKLPPKKRVGLAIAVAGFYREVRPGCEKLFSQAYNWIKVRQQAQKICLLWSDNDPFVSWEQTLYLARQLQIKPTVMFGQGHFDLESNYRFKQFPELFSLIKKSI